MTSKDSPTSQKEFSKERQQFRALLLANPNYFGNLEESSFTPVLSIKSNSSFEEIGCVGFQPQFSRLETVVNVKNPYGYGGDICSNGSKEFIRHYISDDDGTTWQDLGLTSFKVYNIPEGTTGPRQLEYASTLRILPQKSWCFTENIKKIRTILSWNNSPPADQPNWQPVWGDVHETHIQIDPRQLFLLDDVIKDVDLDLTDLLPLIDTSQELKLKPRPTLSLSEKHKLYRGDEVPPLRYAVKDLKPLLDGPSFSAIGHKFLDLDIDIQKLIPDLFPTKGNVHFEELECIGYNSLLGTLVGTIRVKRPLGYGGGLCTSGSKEFVTFYADFDGNGSFETCLGTTSVDVHDIRSIPAEGLEYSAFLPVDFSKYRKRCESGPVIVPIRAILSFDIPAQCFNPNYIPVYGNRVDSLICLEPGIVHKPGVHIPIIQTVGSMAVNDINPNGYANGQAALAGFTAVDSPFGGVVVLTGHIGNTADLSAGAPPLKYRVEVSENNGLSWQRVDNNFTLHRDQLLNGVWSDLPPIQQSVDADGYYDYQEDLVGGFGNAQIFPVGNVLARWQTAGLSGRWLIRIVAKHPITNLSWSSAIVPVHLDNTAPQTDISITSGGGDCADFVTGNSLQGAYKAIDDHFGSLRLQVLPTTIGGAPSGGSFTAPGSTTGSSTMPVVREFAGVPTAGENGNFTLDTSGMQRCGYVIEIVATDRTIVNSGAKGRSSRATVGFCLREVDDE